MYKININYYLTAESIDKFGTKGQVNASPYGPAFDSVKGKQLQLLGAAFCEPVNKINPQIIILLEKSN